MVVEGGNGRCGHDGNVMKIMEGIEGVEGMEGLPPQVKPNGVGHESVSRHGSCTMTTDLQQQLLAGIDVTKWYPPNVFTLHRCRS